MHEETRHFLAVLSNDFDPERDTDSARSIVRECAAAMFGAAVGEARRLVRERGDGVGAELRRLAGLAESIEVKLPHRLYLAWRAHFVDGRALAEYARIAGVDAATARGDYRDLVCVLVTLVDGADVETARPRRPIAVHLLRRS